MRLTKEQKEAIEELSKKAVICNYEERDYPNMICFKKDMIIILNLIEKLQKENEELKRLMAHKNGYTKLLEEDLFENCSNYVIPIQTIKEKIEELTKEGRHYNANKIEVLQELLEESE